MEQIVLHIHMIVVSGLPQQMVILFLQHIVFQLHGMALCGSLVELEQISSHIHLMELTGLHHHLEIHSLQHNVVQ